MRRLGPGAWGWVAGVTVVTALAAAPAGAQGLSGALDRQETQRAIQQFDMRQEATRQRQETQRMLDQNQLQQLLDRQQTIRQAPIPPPVDPFDVRRGPGSPFRR